jgi:hypothetical protein
MAQNQLVVTQANLQKTLEQLSSGSRINTGADDAAGLAIADGLQANVTALTQSALNATEGVGKLQVADGALSQVTTLLNRAVTGGNVVQNTDCHGTAPLMVPPCPSSPRVRSRRCAAGFFRPAEPLRVHPHYRPRHRVALTKVQAGVHPRSVRRD